MIKYLISLATFITLFACTPSETTCEAYVQSTNRYFHDQGRNRQIPTQIYALSNSTEWNGELVILNCGYGSSPTEYSYLTTALAEKGYYVVSIQHEIQTDELLPSGEDMIALRTPNWLEGLKSMEIVLSSIRDELPNIRTEKMHVIGHSNGGDISALFAKDNPTLVRSLITLDHRRMPIHLSKEYRTLSFRADEFEADPGVIPSPKDQKVFDVEIIYLKDVAHNYLRDIATEKTKERVISSIVPFLEGKKK